MKLRAFGQTDKGRARSRNEDDFRIDEALGLFIVADGMGGHAAGDVASKMAVDVVWEHAKRSAEGSEPYIGVYDEAFSDTTNRIASGIQLANQVIYEAAQENPARQGMGTTVSAALYEKKRLSIGHVGDSRIYLIRDSSIEQLTEDHTLVSEQIKQGLLTSEEAEHSRMRNIITRALGAEKSVKIDLKEFDLMERDRIVLCSDGLTTMVTDDDILSTVNSTNDPEKACRMLIDRANGNGGNDNITVLFVYI